MTTTEPKIVHYAQHQAAQEAACGADLHEIGTSFRWIVDAGITCPGCRDALDAQGVDIPAHVNR